MDTSSLATEVMVRLLSRHQAELFRYIFALLPHVEDARDVLQETSVALFRKVADYDDKQPFLPWAHRFAYLEVLKQRERNQRGRRLLSMEAIQRLAREREQHEPVLQERLLALEHCLKALPGSDRELIRQRYRENCDSESMARQLGTSRRSLFRELDRIRRALLACITRHTAADAP